MSEQIIEAGQAVGWEPSRHAVCEWHGNLLGPISSSPPSPLPPNTHSVDLTYALLVWVFVYADPRHWLSR